jgi:DNA processing protein
MEKENLRFVLSLLQVPNVGNVLAKNLIAYCGSARAVFHQKKSHLIKIPGVGQKIASNILAFKDFDKSDAEVAFIEKHQIKPLYFLEEDYPARLKEIIDAPIVLFYKGNANLNQGRVLGIVGTRKATDYGKSVCEKLISDLAPYNPLIISGLAYGIDYMAHKASLSRGLQTVGVLGHGLDIIYPAAHRSIAVKMVSQGGLLTEYPSGVGPDREHFPARNRIVAGMIDGLVLVETTRFGGALITAEIASSYNREVFAFPGRAGDEYSTGCNHLIKVTKAYLIENAEDLVYFLGWQKGADNIITKKKYIADLSTQQQAIVNILQEKEKAELDYLTQTLDYGLSEISVLLLDMEFKGIIQALPGKCYRLA